MKRQILNILLLGFATGATYGQDGARRAPEIRIRFVPDSIMIGDRFRMELDIDKDAAQEIHLPQFENNQLTEEIEALGIDGVDTLEQVGRRIKLRVNYRMTSFEEGVHSVLGFPVLWTDGGVAQDDPDAVPDTVWSKELAVLRVGTFAIDTTKQTPFDIKRPLNTPLIFAEIRELVLWGVVIVAVLGGIVYFVVRYVQRRRGRVRPKAVLPPHVVAIRALEKLHSRKLWQNGKHKEYYSALTDIVRVYIERRYGIWAMEMTSDQILAAMETVNEERLRAKLKELFGLADLVKFAKMFPRPEDNEQAYFDAYFYVEETKEMEVLPDGTPVADLKEEKEACHEA